jgi:hypothetical protein
VRRKYTKKVKWGVSAEWSAKSEVQRESAEKQVQGECRKTSADKEPTTHLNTLGGSDHVRIYGLPPLPPTSGSTTRVP